jgi:Type II intron maturase
MWISHHSTAQTSSDAGTRCIEVSTGHSDELPASAPLKEREKEQIKGASKAVLHETLKLRVSEEKTTITNARAEEAHFLGTPLAIGKGDAQHIVCTTNHTGKRFNRRSTGWETQMDAPLPKLIQRLKEKGFCPSDGKPLDRTGWRELDTEQIRALGSAVHRAIQNGSRFADNWRRLTSIP